MRLIGYILLLLCFIQLTACGPVYVPPRLATPNVDKKGDVQIDIATSPQASVYYAVSDSLFIAGDFRSSNNTSSSQGDVQFADVSDMLGGGFGLGYQRRLKSHKYLKYTFLGGSYIDSWSGQWTDDWYDEEMNTSSNVSDTNMNDADMDVTEMESQDLALFQTMLFVPYAQFILSYGGRYTNVQLSTRASYLQPFASNIDKKLTINPSTLLEYALSAQVSIYERLSITSQLAVRQLITEPANSYFVFPFAVSFGLSYSFGSDGSLKAIGKD